MTNRVYFLLVLSFDRLALLVSELVLEFPLQQALPNKSQCCGFSTDLLTMYEKRTEKSGNLKLECITEL